MATLWTDRHSQENFKKMTPQPLVTVGIPAYNAERFIALAIRSVLNQTYKNIELIITDDGSTDKTVEIAHSFIDSRIRVISDGENQGISYRLNQQIGLANGEFFARMDADDVMLPDRIERQVKYLLENADVDVISGEAIVIDNNNKIIGIRNTPDRPYHFTLNDWIGGKTLTHPTVMGRIDFFRTNGYRSDFNGVEDIDLWLRTCQHYKLMILPLIAIYYRDPLKFKIKTYQYRRCQSEKLFSYGERTGILNHSIALTLIRNSRIKRVLAAMLHLLKLDSLMISRRNAKFYGTYTYESILSDIEKDINI